jgi:hypothetical protein
VEAQDAYAAVKVIDGAWKWEPDDVTYWREDQRRSFKPGLGLWLAPRKEFSPVILEAVPKNGYPSFAAFQEAVLHDSLTRSANRVDYSSAFYHTTVTLFTDFKQPPQIDGKAIDFESPMSFAGGVLQSSFGGHEVKLHVFHRDYLFAF